MRERLAPDSGGATRKVGSRKSEMVAIIRGADRDQVSAVAKRHGVSEQRIYTWRKRFGGLEASDVRRLRQLEAENAREEAGGRWLVYPADSRNLFVELRPALACTSKFCFSRPSASPIDVLVTFAARPMSPGRKWLRFAIRPPCCRTYAMQAYFTNRSQLEAPALTDA